MNRRTTRSLLVVAASSGLVLTASPALAGEDTGAVPEGSGPWAPVEEVLPGYYDPVDVAACGTTVAITPGDVADREGRITELPDGRLVIESRGAQTIDLTRQDTGQMIDELNVSGPYFEVVSADGTYIIGIYEAPTILYPYPELGPVDAAAFEAAGIPDLAYVKKGVVRFDLVIDPETGQAVTEEADVDARVIDLCTWFDGNRGHGNGNGNGNGHKNGNHRD
jgi:hypothetical protein